MPTAKRKIPKKHVIDSEEPRVKLIKKSQTSETETKSDNLTNQSSSKQLTTLGRPTIGIGHKRALEKFINAQPHFDLISDSSNTDCGIEIDADEEELWIVECPRDIEINQFLNGKFTLPEGDMTEHDSVLLTKDRTKEFECHSESLNREKYATLICQTGGLPKAFSVKQSGVISIRERFNLPQRINSVSCNSDNDNVVAYPKNLKMRHPLFGIEIENEKEDATKTSKKNKKCKEENHSGEELETIKTEPVYSQEEAKKSKRKYLRELDTIKSEPESPQKEDLLPTKKKKKHHRRNPTD